MQLRKNILIWQKDVPSSDKAPAYTYAVLTVKLHELLFELANHPLYSSDWALCDFFLFPDLKKS